MPKAKKSENKNIETLVNLSYVILGLLLVVIAGLIMLFLELNI